MLGAPATDARGAREARLSTDEKRRRGARRAPPTWQDPAVWRVWLAQGAIGAALGWLLVTSIFVVEWAAGWVALVAVAAPGAAVVAIGVGLGRALLVGAVEEGIFRGLLLDSLRRPLGTPAALVVSALAFGAFHLWNANVTPLAIANLVLAGLLFGLAFLVGRGLALPIGLHAAWNFFEGSVYGFPVSGAPRDALLGIEVQGPALATGGAFGPEGGLVGLGAVLLTALVLWLVRARVPFPSARARATA